MPGMSTDARTYLLGIDHLLTEEERLTWKSAREFCQSRILPVIEQHYEAARCLSRFADVYRAAAR